MSPPSWRIKIPISMTSATSVATFVLLEESEPNSPLIVLTPLTRITRRCLAL